MKTSYLSSNLIRGLICTVYTLISFAAQTQELPCGERRILVDGRELTEEHSGSYHYLESGSVTLKDGFIGKDGFSLKPSINCNQTRPVLEELVYKYAPQIRHHSQENYRMSSVDWFLNRAVMVNAQGSQVSPFPLLHLSDEIILDYNNENYHLIATHGDYQNGDWASAKTYVHIQRAYHQSIPYFSDDIEIQYWLFYPWNGDQGISAAAHEGDWEFVKVIVGSDGELKRVIASEHATYNDYEPGEFQMYNEITQTIDSQGTHPVLYSANESHALYNDTGWQHQIYDDTNNGGHKFNAWEPGRLEIVEIGNLYANHAKVSGTDKVELINHGIEYVKPNWLNFIGRWGHHNVGPEFGKTKKDKWIGSDAEYYHYYTRDEAVPGTFISGDVLLCSEDEYSFSRSSGISVPVKWSSSGLLNEIGEIGENYVVEPLSSSSGAGNIRANFQVSNVGYDITYEINKEVWTGDYDDAYSYSDLYYLNCRGGVYFYFDPSAKPISVTWETTGEIYLSHSADYDWMEDWSLYEFRADSYLNNSPTYKVNVGTATATIETQCGTFTKSFNFDMACDLNGVVGRALEGQVTEEDQVPDEEMSNTDSETLADFQLYPNPTTGQVIIKLVSDGTTISNVRAEVFDYSGRIIENFRIEQMDGPYFDLDLSRHEKGLYLIRVFQGGVPIFESKVLKQ